MKTHNPETERIKRQYFTYLREAKRFNDASVDSAAMALYRFENYTGFRDFKLFHTQQAVAFKRRLAEQPSPSSGKQLSKATLYSTLTALRNFFHWLAGQPGYRSRLSYSDAEYFNLSEKETRIAKAHREIKVPTIEQILHVLKTMPTGTAIAQRNQALIAFALLTGARDRAIASFKLKHIDLTESCVVQDAREVETKFSKTFTTWFFPVGNEVHQIVEGWVAFLKTKMLWGLDDPLFPATLITLDANLLFAPAGLDRRHWSDAGPIRTIFKEAFERARIPYFNPHSFRKTLVRLGQVTCRSPEDFKAWSQNLGHEKVMTTFANYGEVESRRQGEIIRGLARARTSTTDLSDLLTRAAKELEGKSTA